MATSRPQEKHFRRLFDSHHQAIQNYCFRRLPAADANDAVAEVFLVAWRRLPDAPVEGGELPWLYGISRNVVSNAQRSKRRSGRLKTRLSGVAAEREVGPESLIVRRAEEREALDALSRLRPEDQEIVRLRTWEELSNQQIAEIVGLSVRAVESRLTRARRKLARMLEPTPPLPGTARPRPADGGGER